MLPPALSPAMKQLPRSALGGKIAEASASMNRKASKASSYGAGYLCSGVKR